MNGERWFFGVLGIAVLVAAGCGSADGPAPRAVDEPVAAKFDETADLESPAVETRPGPDGDSTVGQAPAEDRAETPPENSAGQVAETPDEPAPPGPTEVKIEKVTVTAYDGLRYKRSYANDSQVIEVFRKEGHVFLAVQTDVSIQWGEPTSLSVPKDEVVLTDERGQTHMPLGRESEGQYSFGGAFDARQPYSSQEPVKSTAVSHSAVFLVPRDTKPVAFKLGTIGTAEISMPDEVQPPPPPTFPPPHLPGTNARFEVLDARLIDQLPGSVTLGDEKHATSITSLRGKILQIDFRMTPLRHTSERDGMRYFGWNTPDIGLLDSDGQYVPTIGEKFVGGVANKVGHSQDFWQGKWRVGEFSFLFAVPPDTESFTLTYQMTPVAEGKVGGPYKTIEVK
jgi:hypothetical protein